MNYPIPDAALKETGAIIGRVGSGKTYTAKGIVERMLTDQARVCIVDPTGVWWGLRSSADGKSPGFPVVVFGGDHADVPLTEGMGGALAETLAGQNLPAIVDVSEFSMAGRVRFMTAFLEELYTLNRMPLTLVIDEADLFAPQRPGKEQLTMLGRMEQICRRGRVRGFRPWLITQRPASLHKAVLSQANTLVAMQLTSPQDRDALGDWIEGQADRVQGKRILAELPQLKKGEGFVWAPHHQILERVKFPAIATFDSSRSPEDGVAPPPVKLAAVDLSKIGAQLRKLEEAEEGDDAAALRARVAELEEQLAGAVQPSAVLELDTLTKERAAGVAEGRAQAAADWAPTLTRVRDALGAAVHALDEFGEQLLDLQEGQAATPPPEPTVTLRRTTPVVPAGNGAAPGLGNSGKRRMLIALAQNRAGLTPTKLSLLTGISRSGGTWRTYLGELRAGALVENDGDKLRITAAGAKALGSFEPLPTGRKLIDYWRGRLGESGKRKIFDAVVAAYPKAMPQERVAEQTQIAIGGGTWRTYLGELRGLELVVGRSEIKASPELFQ
jgi:hypothetical protein